MKPSPTPCRIARPCRLRRCLSALLLIFLAAAWFVPLYGCLYHAAGASESHEIDRPLINTLLVSLLVSGAAAALSTLTGAAAGYSISQKRFFGRSALYGALVGAMFFPPVAFIVPLFRITAALGIYDSLAALILPFSATAFAVVYMKVAFDRLPRDVLDAAKMDGLSEAAIFTRIAAPLTRSHLAALFGLQFLIVWGALAVPFAVVQSPGNYTLALRLAQAHDTAQFIPRREMLWLVGLVVAPAAVIFACKARTIIDGVIRSLARHEAQGS